MKTLIRTLHPEVKVIDQAKGIVDYVSSDETVDHHREIIRAGGWRFTYFKKNAPFVDSHNYNCIDRQLGKVIDFRVQDGRLVERVQWAIDVPDNKLAQLGWKMTLGGYLKAVSVGFIPIRSASSYDSDPSDWREHLSQLGLTEETGVRRIYLEQEQYELSACIIGANPNALARAYKGGAIGDEDLENLSKFGVERETAEGPDHPVEGSTAKQRARLALLMQLTE